MLSGSAARGHMGIGLIKIKHVKLPVTDLRRSVSWYQSVLDLELHMEFVEQGVLRGVSLLDREGGYEIALRDREVCAGTLDFTGFDVFALSALSRATLEDLAARCDRLGVAHSGVHDFPIFGAGMDIPDPDGTVVRIVWIDPNFPPFLGVDSHEDGVLRTYFSPRLTNETAI
jgi:catechol 2,3-dioxygenase-like lactoylglutathione lyase family enzyme